MRRALGMVALALVACAHAPSSPPSEGPRTSPAATSLSVEGQPLRTASADVLVDPAATPDEVQGLSRTYAGARSAVAEALGPLVSEPPLAIFCKTPQCNAAFAGSTPRSWSLPAGTRFPNGQRSWRSTIVVLRMDEGAGSFAAHEMVHRELAKRLHGAHVPSWFGEGLAAFVGNAPTCRASTPPVVDDLQRLDGERAWFDYTNFRVVTEPAYCQAKAEVGGWIARFGRERLLALIQAVADGKSFAAEYGPMRVAPTRPRLTPLVTFSTDFSDAQHGFSLALWVKPQENAGVLADLSENPIGTGWCAPLLGFDSTQHLVGQLLARGESAVSNYTMVRDPGVLPKGSWAHVAMTWAPGGQQRLYVNGALVADVAAGANYADQRGAPMYVTWGSYNLAGPSRCWPGAIEASDFSGAVGGMRVSGEEWTPVEVAQWAAQHP